MLTDVKIKASKPRDRIYKVYDSGGLYLEVPPAGSKRWRLKYRYAGVERRISLGTYPAVSLLDARARRDDALRKLAAGVDPSPRRSVAPTAKDTFRTVAEEWMDKNRGVWSARHLQTTEGRLKLYLYPFIGSRPMSELDPLDVLNALRVIEKRGALEAAKRTLGICSRVFRYGVATQRVKSDICRDLLGALAKRAPVHLAAITEPDKAGQLMRSINGYAGSGIVRCALLLTAYTFCRPGEVVGARWAEIDLNGGVWTIPAERMKMRREHVVPLSRQALGVLHEVQDMQLGRVLVFPSVRTRNDSLTLSNNTMLCALRSMGYAKGTMTPHGFRAMASTLLNQMGTWSVDAIERQLAHVENDKSRRPYNRHEYMEERTAMMQAYADYLDSLRGSMFR